MAGNGRFHVADDYLLIGRTFAECAAMFDLDADDLAGRRVLDCGGGVGAFAAVASAVGADATAVDPAYAASLGDLAAASADALDTLQSQLLDQREQFVWDYYGDPETRVRYLRAAREHFFADCATHPGRYVAAGLPELPFEAGTFDLALCGNLLFLYDDRLDRAFHLSALRELARVAGEVRVFPLSALDRERSDFVDSVVDDLRAKGHSVAERPVPYGFQPGATTMLVVGDDCR